MFNLNEVKFHFECQCDYVFYDLDNDYIAMRSNWDCNAPNEYELIQAGPEPAPVSLCASPWDVECPF